MGPTIPKEMKYNLPYGDVWGDVLLPPHGTNTGCKVVKSNVKSIAFGNKEHTTQSLLIVLYPRITEIRNLIWHIYAVRLLYIY